MDPRIACRTWLLRKPLGSLNYRLNSDNFKDIGATCGFALRYFVWEVSITCDASNDRLRQM